MLFANNENMATILEDVKNSEDAKSVQERYNDSLDIQSLSSQSD